MLRIEASALGKDHLSGGSPVKRSGEKLLGLCLPLVGAALPLAAEIHDLEFASLAQYRGFSPLFGRPGVRLGDGSYAVVWTEAFQDARLQWVRPDGSQILPPGGLSLGRTWAQGNPVA